MISPIAGKSVTVNITNNSNYKNEYGLNNLKLIKVLLRKRVWIKILNVNKYSPYSHTLTCKKVYSPSPKSTLRNKSVFSKFKIELKLDK